MTPPMKPAIQPSGEPGSHAIENRSFSDRRQSAEGRISNSDRWIEFKAASQARQLRRSCAA
jgi:hypothetical protein